MTTPTQDSPLASSYQGMEAGAEEAGPGRVTGTEAAELIMQARLHFSTPGQASLNILNIHTNTQSLPRSRLTAPTLPTLCLKTLLIQWY